MVHQISPLLELECRFWSGRQVRRSLTLVDNEYQLQVRKDVMYRGKYAQLLMGGLVLMSPAWAQTDSGSAPVLQTLVVTADLLERSASENGNSVEIYTQDELENRAGLVSLRDVLDNVTNLTLVTGTGKAPTLRGVDGTGPAENANAFFAGSRPRLSWQIDGRPASYNEVVFGDLGLFDVERIEVLRGPQSTVVGRNAIAGTVVVKTHDPVFKDEGALRLAAGDHDQQQVSGMFNIPFGEQLAVRLSADWLQKESAVSYDPFPGVDNPAEIEALSLQGKLMYLPDTERDSLLLLTLSHRAYSGPNGEIIVRPFDARRSNFPQQPRHEPKYTSLIGDYSLMLDSAWEFTLKTSTTEFDFTRTAVPGTSSATIDTREYTLEPQLHYASGGMKAVTGLYYYRARQNEFIEFLGGQHFDDRTDTLAAYAEGIIPLSGSVDLSLGLRYEQEDRQRHGGDATGALVQIAADETYDALLPKLGVNWRASTHTSWGMHISKGYNSGGGGITFNFPIVNYEYQEETAWTYELYGRQEFANGRVRTTQNLFHSRYRDMQLPFDLTPENSHDEAFVVRNADAVNTIGLELGLDAALTEALVLSGGFAWLDTEVAEFPNSGIEGNQLLTAPEFSANLALSWKVNHWHASLSARYSDSYFTDVNNRPRGKTDAYVVGDAQLSYQAGRARWFAHVKNLFDADSPIARYPGFAPAGSSEPDSTFDSAVLLQPRSFLVGVQLNY
jgi:iron complex outermembrane receptor protein